MKRHENKEKKLYINMDDKVVKLKIKVIILHRKNTPDSLDFPTQ